VRTGTPIDADAVVRSAARLGFEGDDLTDLETAARKYLHDPANRGCVSEVADRVRSQIGDLTVSGQNPWAGLPDGPDDGLVPMLALLATADDVIGFQRSRGVAEESAWHNLADVGQQVWVHRLTYGRFGLHTQGWLRIVWAGSFAWLGRLQFNLQRLDPPGDWVLSTHIPRRSEVGGSRSGSLAPASVDDSFRRAVGYFAAHFPDVRTVDFWCSSWLLDPVLAAALPDTNIAAFQRRWALEDQTTDGDEDAVFFTFARRPPVEVAELPRRTRLERAVVDRLVAGEHWAVRSGRIPQHDLTNVGSESR
jgi:GNAT-like C-terminal domain/N-acyltransferase N-terminal domain